MKSVKLVSVLLCVMLSCKAQDDQVPVNNVYSTKTIGGGCDGCELMYVDMPKRINDVDTSAGWETNDAQKLMVTGTIFKNDGRTPAPDVIVYYWHTNSQGLYISRKRGKAKNHGDLKGWIKTNTMGRYCIYTSRPASYPKDSLPAHIHFAIKEPELPNEYYCDDIVFDDDPLLIPYLKRYPPANRCGSGTVRLLLKDDIRIAEHDIVLGLHIPNYPNTPK